MSACLALARCWLYERLTHHARAPLPVGGAYRRVPSKVRHQSGCGPLPSWRQVSMSMRENSSTAKGLRVSRWCGEPRRQPAVWPTAVWWSLWLSPRGAPLIGRHASADGWPDRTFRCGGIPTLRASLQAALPVPGNLLRACAWKPGGRFSACGAAAQGRFVDLYEQRRWVWHVSPPRMGCLGRRSPGWRTTTGSWCVNRDGRTQRIDPGGGGRGVTL